MVTTSIRRLLGLVCGFALACMAAAPAWAQDLPPVTHTATLSGPRFGVSVLPPNMVNELGLRGVDVRPSLTQFGWQWEKQYFTRYSGMTVVNEWAFLLGGLEQSLALPSVSWVIGVRTHGGAEFGLGPNASPAGIALVLAAGYTFRTGAFNVPVNVAVVPSHLGSRVSILTGFNLRR